MFRIIRASFNQRRKTLVNGLNNSPDITLSREDVTDAVEQLGKGPSVRGEALTLQEFAQLSNIIAEKISDQA
jgi:16S rRNA (adenine1518-N6/adenine1519-N6)-dimethyltransferase